MSNTSAESKTEIDTEPNNTVSSNEDEEPIDPKVISDALNNNEEAKDLMEKMFSSLLSNPELSSALMNPEISNMLGGLGAGLGGLGAGLGGLGAGLGGLGAGLADVTDDATENSDEQQEEIHRSEDIPTPDGLEDITTTIQESSNFPHEIEKTITELEDTRVRKYELQVKFESEDVKALYDMDNNQYDTDSGWDLKFKEDIVVPAGALGHKIDFGVSVCCTDYNFDECALWLVPRSSIVKTPLRLANSLGLIDSSYRGTLRAYVDNRNNNEPYTLKKGERLFQIATPSLQRPTFKVVKELPKTARGENGFGSTGA
jgi:dUTP pyrophosphatase